MFRMIAAMSIAVVLVLCIPACGERSASSDDDTSDVVDERAPASERDGDEGDAPDEPAGGNAGGGAPGREPGSEPGPATGPRGEPGELALDECDLDTQWAGDEYCILPPPPEQGFQLHIGPTDYDNPEPQFVMEPGQEDTVSMSTVSGNDRDIHYYYRQYRMRPGSHHVIVTAGGGFGGRRLGGTQNLAKDNPGVGEIAPENAGVGLPLAANTSLSLNMHYYNFGDQPIIREVWVNFWYVDADKVTEPATEMFSMTGVTAAVAHSHVVVGAECPISRAGRVLSMYGHRHLNNIRFSAWRVRGGQRDLLMEDYDPEHPAVLDFNSITPNAAPDPQARVAGGWNGILDLEPGDVLSFECEIVNMTDQNFVGLNEAANDEMCILVGDTVGTQVPGFCSAIPARRID
jgi:hypothetical protein